MRILILEELDNGQVLARFFNDVTHMHSIADPATGVWAFGCDGPTASVDQWGVRLPLDAIVGGVAR